MASKPIVLILGAGSNNGSSLARKFSADGYTVAISSRRVENGTSPEGYITIQGDYAEKDAIPSIFERLKSVAGIPNVVIYNAGMLTPPSPPDDVLSIPVTAVEKDLWVNTLSPLTAAQQAIKGFKELPEGGNKIFIYTGNKLNSSVIPVGAYFTLGMGKAASAYWVGSADLNYSKNGYRFFYADERTPEGDPAGLEIDGEAHAEFYKQLVDRKDSSIPWHATFVKGKGYVNFSK